MIKNKVIHKLDSSNHLDVCREIKTKCKVHNKTYIFNYSRNWKKVSCKKCLKHKEKANE